MWIEKDIMTAYTTMPKEQIAPVIATTIAVSLIKVAAIAGGILLIKWAIRKFKNRQTNSIILPDRYGFSFCHLL